MTASRSTETSPSGPGLLDRMRHWAILRIVVQAAAAVAVVAVSSRVLSLFVPAATSPLHDAFAMGRNLIVAALALGAYALLVRGMEKRPAREIAIWPGLIQFPAGLVVGAGMMAAVYGVLYLMKLAVFGVGTGWDGITVGFVVALLAAVFEELLLRAVLFRILEQACGTTVALLVSAAVFGLLHSFNHGATPFSDLAIALEAGLMLALAYAVTRNLWLAIGIHAGWNFTEGNVFGAQVSGGSVSHSLIHSTLTGPLTFTGGSFGPEASMISIGVSAVVSLVFVVLVLRQRGWKPMGFRLAVD
jgi:membrane protease YdiL (CAAX protease family)